jgi:hypothetical protein
MKELALGVTFQNRLTALGLLDYVRLIVRGINTKTNWNGVA